MDCVLPYLTFGWRFDIIRIMTNKLSSEVIDQIHSLRALGHTLKYIASKLGISGNAVCRYLSPEVMIKQTERQRERRSHRVYTTINGKTRWYKVEGRRPKPESCELCPRENLTLNWHHWDDEDLSLGMWLCWGCHRRATIIEGDFVEKYLKLKSKLCKEVSTP